MDIRSLRDLKKLASNGVVILIQRDSKVNMASVSVGGRNFMDGNFWDFKPECHGGFHYHLAERHGRWTSTKGLVEVLKTFLEANGATNVTVIEEVYDWASCQGA